MRAGTPLAALATALAVMTCAGGEAQDPNAVKRQITRLLDRGDPLAAADLLGRYPHDSGLQLLRGVVAARRGRTAEADSAFRGTAGPDRFAAGAQRAELLLSVGRIDEALAQAEAVASTLEQSETLPATDWLALGIAYRVLGRAQPAQFKDALAALDRAVAADSTLLEAHLRLGGLFLDKYNAPEARTAFREVLRRDPDNPRAQLGLAEAALFDGDRESFRMLDQVAKAAPNLARAHALLARLELDSEQPASAVAAADRALGIDSTEVEAWATKTAAALLAGDSAGVRTTEAAVARWHRAPAAFYAAVAEALARQRRYQVAERMAARGVAADSTDPAALTASGTNLLRLGSIEQGRARLAAAFARDPYHVWNKNTLDLFDQTAEHRTVVGGRFQFVAPPQEAELLALYLGPTLERAYDSLAARYGYAPPTPVRLELYGRHADFSVRTVGLAGLGALGVSFGSVLAMDAPSARPPGDFNWLSTAWHELTHAFTLGATDHKVPRWLSEGLSVLEERRAVPGWGAQATMSFVAALKGGILRPVSRMNDGFVRPRHPADVSFAYYQASLLCEFLEEKFGFQAIRKMLAAFREGQGTPDAIRLATGLDIDALGVQFTSWLGKRFETPLKGVGMLKDSVATPGELDALLSTATQQERAGQTDQAIATLERADQIFPTMGDEDSPAWRLAGLYRGKNNRQKAVEYFARVARYSESHLAANVEEATLRLELGDTTKALAALERAIAIHPYDATLHVRAAEAARALDNHPVAIRERQAVIALAPSDRAGALYALAVAYRDAGDRESARREVLKALEEAPSFEKAQELLLELKRGGR